MRAVLQILGLIARIWGWFFDKSHSKSAQYEDAKNTNAKAITSGDAATVNARLDVDLDRLSDNAPDKSNP